MTDLLCIAPFALFDLWLLLKLRKTRRPKATPRPAEPQEPILVIGGRSAKRDNPPTGYRTNELATGPAPWLKDQEPARPASRHKRPVDFASRCGRAVAEVMADSRIGFRPYVPTGASRPQPIKGPRTLTYLMVLDRPANLEKTFRLDEQMALQAQVERTRIARYQGLIGIEFELPRSQWTELPLDRPGAGHHMMLGRNTLNRAMRLDVTDAVHVLVAGETGAGKTVLLTSMLYQAALADPDKQRLLIIDGKQELTAFHRLPHLVAPAMIRPEDALRALAWTAAEILRRGDPGADRTPLIVVIDELALLIGQESGAIKPLVQILSLGRSRNVHVLAGTQRVTGEVLGDPMIKDNFTYRLAGKVSNAEASALATNLPGMGAQWLSGRGDFLAVHGQATRFVAAVATQKQLAALPQAPLPIPDITAGTSLEALAMVEKVQAPACTTPAQYAAVIAAWVHNGQGPIPGIGKIKEFIKEGTGQGVGTERAKRIQGEVRELTEALDQSGVLLSRKETYDANLPG